MSKKKKVSVGKSHRTPFKHWVLNQTLGSIAGIVGRRAVPYIQGDFHVIDLCAGDGDPGEYGSSSPQIIAKHCRFVQDGFREKNYPFRAKATLIEKSAMTFDRLASKEQELSEGYTLELIHGDARDYRVEAKKNQAVFINGDPNHINDMPLAEGLVESFPNFTTMTLTLGCNAGGLKRQPFEERQKWFDYVDMCCKRMKSYHDAIICSVRNDCAQWAYLSVIPKKHSERCTKELVRKGKEEFDYGVDVASYRSSFSEWDAIIKRLFLTKKELKQEAIYADAV